MMLTASDLNWNVNRTEKTSQQIHPGALVRVMAPINCRAIIITIIIAIIIIIIIIITEKDSGHCKNSDELSSAHISRSYAAATNTDRGRDSSMCIC